MRKCPNVFELGMPRLTCVHGIWVLKDGSRSLGLFRKGKFGIIAKFHWPDLVI